MSRARKPTINYRDCPESQRGRRGTWTGIDAGKLRNEYIYDPVHDPVHDRGVHWRYFDSLDVRFLMA